jgi:asparagine synthase (glutamine-hydrolysing)
MCGILGYISTKIPCSKASFKTALDAMSLRGPDASGVFQENAILLGHRRLSIIDTSEGANQPIKDASNRYVLVFNGEIFNFHQLRETKLSGFDIPFRTHSDSEVLLYLLIHYGESCLSWLSGFFAFAFYDTISQTTLIARDRFGKKPLIYFQDEDQFIFGSEMKSILPLMPKRVINKESLFLFFQFNYIPPSRSILEGVHKLSPGHSLLIGPEGAEISAYYKITLSEENTAPVSYEDAKQQLHQLMHQSVQDRLISDVPLGAFLSGGIDSSVVVATAAKYTDQLRTFSIGYKDNPLFDESKYAGLVAKKYNTDHEVFYLSERDYKEEIFNVLDYLDEPFADSSCIPQYILCKKTKPKVTVALSGDGGDEVFAGYNKHRAEWMFRNKPMMAFVAKSASPILKRLPQNKNSRIGNITRKMVKLANGARLTDPERYIQWCSILGENEVNPLFTTSFQNSIRQKLIRAEHQKYSSNIKSNDFNEILLSDMQLVLPGDMLYKVDMMSMANSLEVRSPFLDHRIVDFAFQLSASYKIDQQLNKRIVQDAFRNDLPAELYNRPKQGFEIPLLNWFREDLNSFIFDDLLNPVFIEEQGIFDYSAVQNIKSKLHSNNPGYIQATVWAFIVFQSWYKKYMI